jgi:hypothetical protein
MPRKGGAMRHDLVADIVAVQNLREDGGADKLL